MPVWQAYLSELYSDDQDKERLYWYCECLLNPQATLNNIDHFVVALEGYRVTELTARNPRIQRAWSALRRFVEDVKPTLIAQGAALWVYGSMVYDDPGHLDYDILLTSETFTHEFNQRTVRELMDLLENQYWFPENIGTEGHITCLSLGLLKKFCLSFQRGDRDSVVAKWSYIHQEFHEPSILLTGVPYFLPNSQSPDELRNRVRQLISQNPMLAAIAATDLEETLLIRQTGQKDPYWIDKKVAYLQRSSPQ